MTIHDGATKQERLAPGLIDDDMIDMFERDGAVAVRGLFDERWIELLRASVDEILPTAYDPRARMGQTGDDKPETLTANGMWEASDAFRRFLFESPIGEAAATVSRSQSARLFEDLMIYRESWAKSGTSWHQDEPGWPVGGRQLSSVWFSLDEVTADTGAMRFVAGSHRGPMYDPGFAKSRASQDARAAERYWTGGPVPDVDADPARYCVITIEAEPGDAVVFHPRALHTAYGGSPSHPRRTFTIRFLGDDVRWTPKGTYYHAWMRDCGLQEGDEPDHPRLPVVWHA
jgi:ectoine hydroxylase-related dioxygenase (phytanoyl-CoA dioxygenase family)